MLRSAWPCAKRRRAPRRRRLHRERRNNFAADCGPSATQETVRSLLPSMRPTRPVPASAIGIKAKCRKEWVRLISNNPESALTGAIDQRNICLRSTRHSIARGKAALADSGESRPAVSRCPAAPHQSAQTGQAARKPAAEPARAAHSEAPPPSEPLLSPHLGTPSTPLATQTTGNPLASPPSTPSSEPIDRQPKPVQSIGNPFDAAGRVSARARPQERAFTLRRIRTKHFPLRTSGSAGVLPIPQPTSRTPRKTNRPKGPTARRVPNFVRPSFPAETIRSFPAETPGTRKKAPGCGSVGFESAPNGAPVAGSQQDDSGPFRLQACPNPPAPGTR